jgi:hypothetical protein
VSVDDPPASWPAAWQGTVESVVTTLGPNDRWNVAALGLAAPETGGDADADAEGDGDAGGPVTARTWGRTRTWRNFTERGEGVVQFTRDPVTFVEAACSVREEDDPILPEADAWARVTVTERASGESGGTRWVDWALSPVETAVQRRVVPTTSRAHAAVVEATVAASRLEVPTYDTAALRERIRFFESVVDTAGGPRERAAWERFEALVDWRE